MKNKGSKFRKRLLTGILTAVLILPSLPLLNGCKTNFFYDKANKYSHGDASFSSESVEYIDIDWFNGRVEMLFTADSDADISISESSSRKLDEETSLHYWLDGTVLRIRYAASGKINLGKHEKTLTVILPADKSLMHVNVNSESANIVMQDARAQSLSVSTLAGNVTLNGLRVSNNVTVSTRGGSISGNVATACDVLSINTTSGSISFSTDAKVKELYVETIKGNVFLSNLTTAKTAKITSVSGTVSLEFLDNSGFSLTYSTFMGNLDTEMKFLLDGKKYVYGTPSSEFAVSTTTGDLIIFSIPT